MYKGEGTKVSKFVAEQRLRDELRKKHQPPGWLLDQIADEKLNGKYTAQQRSNKCDRCFQVKSLNGTCGCPE